ncbi:hypothetical protein HK105_202870 [Polyrhizophydium stewartii]|uniref:B-block binding subunit of TFIIIC domain-containing protein n=1 Tax=Polyrhizophydium stewartii TaxID=2732419 RepID=A0ABR4NDQ9_9FUNG
MDEILQTCVEEVAFEGPQGCSPDRMWELVKTKLGSLGIEPGRSSATFGAPGRVPDKQDHKPQADDATRELLWSYLVRLRDMEFLAKRQTGELQKASIHISKFVAEVLSVILRSRTKGITQIELSQKLQKDSRSTHYAIKKLCAANLMQVTPTGC